MNKRQHVICIGAQRTSTTRLYTCFMQHPEIYVPDEKELHYFNSVLPPYRSELVLKMPLITTRLAIKYILKAADAYSKSKYGARRMRKIFLRGRSVPEYYWSRFGNTKLVTCDITPAYSLLSEEGVRLIQKTAPDSKIIFIIRDPIERMWSELNYHYEKTHKNDLSEKINDESYIDSRLTEHHLKRADYANTYKLFKKYFEDVFVIVFEELNKDVYENMKLLCEFIGIDHSNETIEKMPLNEKVNASKGIEIPKAIEKKLLEFQKDNYINNIDFFGNKINKWKYYEHFV